MDNPDKGRQSVSDFDTRMAAAKGTDAALSWHGPDRPEFRLAGFPWYDRDKRFRRLPVTPDEPLPKAVDWLANYPAGGQIAFQSDSRHVAVRVKLAGPSDMVHMPATGQCGFDIYIGPPSAMRFLGVTMYDHRLDTYEALLFESADVTMRTFTLNYPLYQGVDELQIGLEPGADIQAPPAYSIPGRIVCYGTSITQGGCASRPGLAYTNILSRALNAEVVNLGFSGSGKGEPEVCRTFARIASPRLFVLDYEANTDLDGLTRTLPENLRILRLGHPDVPILVVSGIPNTKVMTHPDFQKARGQTRDLQARVVETFRTEGDPLVFFLDGSTLLGEDFGEGTVDGCHPNDLGFMRMALGLEPVIRRILDGNADSRTGGDPW
jgi:hypothetical protein